MLAENCDFSYFGGAGSLKVFRWVGSKNGMMGLPDQEIIMHECDGWTTGRQLVTALCMALRGENIIAAVEELTVLSQEGGPQTHHSTRQI